mmetsp:Transcript_612/g.984  ORF Transcript_612/g.984 Transcript_612/m.984 type:complete len:196 (+) Transcript_612:1376-1963(+)
MFGLLSVSLVVSTSLSCCVLGTDSSVFCTPLCLLRNALRADGCGQHCLSPRWQAIHSLTIPTEYGITKAIESTAYPVTPNCRATFIGRTIPTYKRGSTRILPKWHAVHSPRRIIENVSMIGTQKKALNKRKKTNWKKRPNHGKSSCPSVFMALTESCMRRRYCCINRQMLFVVDFGVTNYVYFVNILFKMMWDMA